MSERKNHEYSYCEQYLIKTVIVAESGTNMKLWNVFVCFHQILIMSAKGNCIKCPFLATMMIIRSIHSNRCCSRDSRSRIFWPKKIIMWAAAETRNWKTFHISTHFQGKGCHGAAHTFWLPRREFNLLGNKANYEQHILACWWHATSTQEKVFLCLTQELASSKYWSPSSE